ncbi:MAG TPA: sigma-70 family RNA polymerase sigma factor [Kofleriaceae bacterium]|nr:sigma-70 family RNA polymerase sigma factor [Kofleriaceae bacterium]
MPPDDSAPPDAAFAAHRDHLRGVAYRMLGSLAEADDAVQEAWLRLHRADAGAIDNLRAWLTTVIARICLDMLRSRKARREEPIDAKATIAAAYADTAAHPEHEAVLADSVGLALLVVLDTLSPAERLAFVLHDLFAMPFDEIAPLVRRTPAATRQLASRARRRLQGAPTASDAELARQRRVVEAFLAAVRGGDFEAIVAVLDPEVAVQADTEPGQPPRTLRGARTWARGAMQFARHIQLARVVLVDGAVGLIMAPRGQLARALRFTFAGDRIAEVDVVSDPHRLRQLTLGVLPDA